MKTRLKRIVLLAFSFSVFTQTRAANVTGTWKSEFDTQIGHLKYVYELKADGNKLAGKAIRELEGQKTEIAIVEGKVGGDEVSFVEPLKFQEQEIRIEYKGEMAGDEIKFTRKVGDFATTEIVAKREKAAAAPSVAGKWQAEFDTQIGKQKYTYEFKVDGDKVTGRALGDIAGAKSETDIREGKLNGSEISFVEMVKFQDQEIHVAYKGKISGDEIKFTRTVAENINEELVAKRVKEPSAR